MESSQTKVGVCALIISSDNEILLLKRNIKDGTADDMRRWGLEVLNPDLPTKVN